MIDFLWGYKTSVIFKNEPKDLADLRRRMTFAIRLVTAQMLNKVLFRKRMLSMRLRRAF